LVLTFQSASLDGVKSPVLDCRIRGQPALAAARAPIDADYCFVGERSSHDGAPGSGARMLPFPGIKVISLEV